MAADTDLFSQSKGNVYLIPLNDQEYIFSQVGYGGDLGIFDGVYKVDEDVERLEPKLLFRVHYGLVSPVKYRWVSLGLLLYKDGLSVPGEYLYRAIGSNECYVITHGLDDKLIECNESTRLEPLATWSHEHVVDRFIKLRA